jgi:exopolyphosphatase/guanosine-5'-triphosphate,3'-diphosphate pyrophosphatase
MPTLGAIDIGSNGMRLAIGFADGQGRLRVVENFREPVRLGQDVFEGGSVTPPLLNRAVQALRIFKSILRSYRVTQVRAVATSALREAHNRSAVLKRFRRETGLDVKTINAEEEAFLVQSAISKRIPLSGRSALLVDVGGGSVEVTFLKNGRIAASESFNMGAVRLLKILEHEKTGERRFNRMVEEYAEAAKRRILDKFGGKPPALCVGTGGSLDELSSLRKTLLNGKDADSFSRHDLARIIRILKATPYEARVKKLGLRPDRADVILPAAWVVEKLIQATGVQIVFTPHVGLKEGLLQEMASELKTGRPSTHRKEAISSAVQLGRKYNYDEAHAHRVSRLAVELFDQTRKLHGLEEGDRLLLEVSAQLHDIGQFVSFSSHHKHSFYLIKSSHIVGLDDDSEEIVANVARYHRKSLPRLKHDSYRVLSPSRRNRVSRLAALLRVADALDYEHSGKVRRFRIGLQNKRVTLRLQGAGDLLLEKWSLLRKSDLFERVFKVKFSVVGQ